MQALRTLSGASGANATAAEGRAWASITGSARVARFGGGDAGWLRVSGQAGDFLLANEHARAVVRAKDGSLVDFWNERPSPSSAPQLKGLTAIDGLGSFRPVLRIATVEFELGSSAIREESGALLLVREIAYGGGRIEATTRYSLRGDSAAVEIATELRHRGGSTLEGLSVGQRVRWGNSDYFVDGRRAPAAFSGPAESVGRRGAGGDLVLRSEGERLLVLYQSTQPGLVGELIAFAPPVGLRAGETHVVRRILAYAPLPEPALPVPAATLEAEVRDEHGRPLAAKLALRGLEGTPTPDFGNDGDESGANRFVWSGSGLFRRPLPPGRYAVLLTAGIERDAARFEVVLSAGKTTRVRGRLPRVLDTPGWISADLHLHQARSPDADIADSTRVISVAAEGVELAVASDHYAVGDLAPALATLVESGTLASRVIAVRGTELTTSGNSFGHFNVFPLDSAEGLPFEDTTPRAMFGAVRERAPEALLQVNHPRWRPGGYFSRYTLDPRSGVVPRRLADEYSADFDALEVWNGFDAWSLPLVRQGLADYLHLLGLGHRYTATGNSDSHGLFFLDPGVPRNLVHYGQAPSDDADLDADPRAVLQAIRRGRVVVSNGPVLDVDLNGAGPGDSLRPDGTPLVLRVRVRAAPWIDVRRIDVLEGPRGRIIRSLPIARSSSTLRLDERLPLPDYRGTFLVVVASGKVPLPNVYRDGLLPFAFTNPIFLER